MMTGLLSAVSIGGGTNRLRFFADIGDSTTALGSGFQCATMFMWACYKTGIYPTHIHGYSGQLTSDVLAAMPHLYAYDTDNNPSDPIFSWVHVSCGINDTTELATNPTPAFTIGDTLANLTAIKDYNLSRGKGTIFSTLSHEDPSSRRSNMDTINAHLFSLAAANPTMVKVADYASIVDNPSDPLRAAKAGYMTGPHYKPELAAEICQPLVDIIHDLAGTNMRRSQYIGNQPSIVPDSDFISNSGTIYSSAGVTASGETAWDVLCGSGLLGIEQGDYTVEFSKEYVDGETHPWQVVNITDGGTEDGAYLLLLSPPFVPADKWKFEMEVYVSDASACVDPLLPSGALAAFGYDIDGVLIFPDGLEDIGGLRLGNAGYAETLNVLARSRTADLIDGAVTTRFCFPWFVKAGATVTFKLRNAGASEI